MKTLDECLEEYLDWRKSLNLSLETIDKNKYGIRPFIRWVEDAHGITCPGDLGKDHLYHWQNELASKTNRAGHPIRPRTINTYVESLKVFLEYLHDRGLVRQSLVREIRYVKKPKHLPGNVLSHKQIRKMLTSIATRDLKGYRDRAILELLYSSGVRAAEITGLNTGDVDHKNRTMMVTGKGNKQRVVPFGITAARHLDTYVTAIRPYLVRDRSEQALFLNKRGKRLGYRALLTLIHFYTDRAGLENVTPHTFRRSCATEMIRGGANMYHVKEMLGHESLDTLKHYVKLTILDLKKTHARCHPREKDNK